MKKLIFKCPSCGASGGSLRQVRVTERCSDVEALITTDKGSFMKAKITQTCDSRTTSFECRECDWAAEASCVEELITIDNCFVEE